MHATSLVAAVILVPVLPAVSVRAAETVIQVKLEDASVNGSLEGMLVKLRPGYGQSRPDNVSRRE
jgi:hypothetical protein